jgi:hypothetical protein
VQADPTLAKIFKALLRLVKHHNQAEVLAPSSCRRRA